MELRGNFCRSAKSGVCSLSARGQQTVVPYLWKSTESKTLDILYSIMHKYIFFIVSPIQRSDCEVLQQNLFNFTFRKVNIWLSWRILLSFFCVNCLAGCRGHIQSGYALWLMLILIFLDLIRAPNPKGFWIILAEKNPTNIKLTPPTSS